MRNNEAYSTTSGLLIGLGIPDFLASLMILTSKAKTASNTILWRTALATWISLGLFLIFQFLVLDYLTSPYPGNYF